MPEQPNILLINTHDSGRFFGCYGIDTVRTPAIDRLSKEGVRMDAMFAVSPICSPSRGAMMTGRYPQRNGLLGLTHHGYTFNPGERHAASLFCQGGYQTVLFQFQHEVVCEEWASLGYEEYRSRESGEALYPYMFRPATEVAGTVAEFLAEPRDRPFFAHVGFNETHTPFNFGGVVPARENGVTVPQHINHNSAAEDHFAHLQGAIEQVDAAVSIILEALDRNKLAANTLVVFYSDHGYEARRDKWTLYDPGIEIPMIFRWPAGLPAGKPCPALRSNVDLLPTLLDLSGLCLPENLDGRSIAPILKAPESAQTKEEEHIFGIYYNGAARCVRTPRYKLIHYLGPEPYMARVPVAINDNDAKFPRPDWELYDLKADPLEANNRWKDASYQKIGQSMADALLAWMHETADPAVAQPFKNHK